jgi:hypothetical protein
MTGLAIHCDVEDTTLVVYFLDARSNRIPVKRMQLILNRTNNSADEMVNGEML